MDVEPQHPASNPTPVARPQAPASAPSPRAPDAATHEVRAPAGAPKAGALRLRVPKLYVVQDVAQPLVYH